MDADEPWVWYWQEPDDRFVIRRMGLDIDDVPEAIPVATAVSRQNGKYIDFAIPPLVVDFVDMKEGEWWEVSALDPHTMIAKRT